MPSPIRSLGPDFRTASPTHVQAVYGRVAPEEEGGLPPLSDAESADLQQKQILADSLGKAVALKSLEPVALTRSEYQGTDGEGKPVYGESEPREIESWHDLKTTNKMWLQKHLGGRDFSEYAKASGMTEEEAHRYIDKVASVGVDMAGAFLEVVPQVLAGQEFEDPNAEIGVWATRSQGFLMEWAGLHSSVDAALTASLGAEPQKINKITDASGDSYIFNKSIMFDKKWFGIQDDKVTLDPEKLKPVEPEDWSTFDYQNMDSLAYVVRGNPRYAQHNRPDKKRSQSVVFDNPWNAQGEAGDNFFGCPGLHMIPALVGKMIGEAQTAGLFGKEYAAERQRIQEAAAVAPVEPAPATA